VNITSTPKATSNHLAADAPAHAPAHASDTEVFDRLESNVRSYCRSFPAVFSTAKGSVLTAADGRTYIDFLAGAGALNFGHNHPAIIAKVVEYLTNGGVVHALDMHTEAKAELLTTIDEVLLAPRNLPYKVQFTGPTGTNAVEAAIKLARKYTGCSNVMTFQGGYHGHSLGGLALTANRDHRGAAGVGLNDATFLPFPGTPGWPTFDTLAFIEASLTDTHSGIDKPAAIILETVQAEGGIICAPIEWLRGLRELCTRHGIVLIVDDIQTGVGRTGPFFSFEAAGIVPDLVTVSKSIGGIGLPMAMVLIREELDVWSPADHTGTFRGHQLAFVAATEAIRLYEREALGDRVEKLGQVVMSRFTEELDGLRARVDVRGRGLIIGVDTTALDSTGALAKSIGRACFDQGLVIERVGRNDTVLKVLPPLVIEEDLLHRGVDIVVAAVRAAASAAV
jgi:diaminobutyrate-2-oxoglutarate transaminase